LNFGTQIARAQEAAMTRLLATLLALAAVTALFSAPARAQIYYPWCANYGGDMGGSANCGFSTREQCLATISGIGGSCDPNLFYTGTPERRPLKPARKARAG
jgi:Protein of unknown function (DUF3551)